jgi:hypothetical protein
MPGFRGAQRITDDRATFADGGEAMFWFLFGSAFSVWVLSFGFMAIVIHRGNMKALEVLGAYAEKGTCVGPYW